jgi:type II secretory pathway pseudopilin PulG
MMIDLRKNKKTNPEAGFLLLELIFVTIVIGVITAGVGNLFLSQLKSAYFVDDQLSKNDLKMEVQNILSVADACNATFTGAYVPGVGAPPTTVSLKNSAGNIVYSTTGPSPKNIYDRITITSIAFTNVSVPGPSSAGVVQLSINLQRIRTGGGPTDLNPLNFNVPVSVGAGRNIIQCGTIVTSPSGIQAAPRSFSPGQTVSCTAPASATGCSAEGEKSCVPDASGTNFTCVSSGARGSRCQLFCRE